MNYKVLSPNSFLFGQGTDQYTTPYLACAIIPIDPGVERQAAALGRTPVVSSKSGARARRRSVLLSTIQCFQTALGFCTVPDGAPQSLFYITKF